MAAPRILVVDDEPNMLRVLRMAFEEEGFVVETADGGDGAASRIEETPFDVVLTDIRMPGRDGMALLSHCRKVRPETPVVLMTGQGSVDLAVAAMKEGARDFVQKPFTDLEDLKTRVKNALRVRALEVENRRLRAQARERAGLENLLGGSAPMQRVREQIRQAAPARTTVLLTGESGTGKELAARALHALSPRAEAPFIEVNCAALPEELLESELFGHEKGAFTGAAAARRGRFETADGGTIFLDEIGDTSAALQKKLLRVLQEQTFERVGGSATLRVDVRVVAATNRDLRRAVEEGTFREDLYFRLAVFEIRLPPLRERGDDALPLAAALLARFAKEHGKDVTGFEGDALHALSAYPWPGNVRELSNAVERAVLVCGAPRVRREDLPEAVARGEAPFRRRAPGSGASSRFVLPSDGIQLEKLEEELLVQALERSEGNQSRAARLLGLSRNALRYRVGELKKRGVLPPGATGGAPGAEGP